MDTPESSGKATAAKKQPPPESELNALTRRLVIAAFWGVALFFGLPLWWKTTSVYRANLPVQSMLDWADGKTCRPVFPLRIAIDAPSVSTQDASNLLKVTQHALDDLNEFSAHHLRLVHSAGGNAAGEGSGESEAEDDSVALKIKLVQGKGTTPRAELLPYSPTLNIYYTPNQLPSSSSTSSPLATFIANELQNVYAEEQATLAYLLAQHSGSQPAKIKSLSPELSESLARQTTRSFKYAPTYHLTFSLFTPTSLPSSWAIESALQEYIEPLTTAYSQISNFTIDTQVQLYATFAPSIQQPEYDQELKAWTLRKDDLSGFINAAEWPLSPSIGTGPTVNFILYVPEPWQSPLVVKENRGTSWLIPQWGGITIFNPQPSKFSKSISVPETLSKEDLAPALLTFSNQLMSLLGLPQTPASLPLRLSTLERVRAASLILSASSTLGSLARLTQALPSIAIPDTVAINVDETISRLHASCNNLREGQFRAALENARVAEVEAEKAFFERSMVGQVYFPDEHKVAVYLPLLGPVSVPLIMAALKEIKKVVKREN